MNPLSKLSFNKIEWVVLIEGQSMMFVKTEQNYFLMSKYGIGNCTLSAKLDIINAWHTTTSRRNKRAAKLYGDTKDWWGWSGTITVPQEFINDFAVILRFPR